MTGWLSARVEAEGGCRRRRRRCMHMLGLALGVSWALPNTMLGLFVGMVGLVFGARLHWSRRECALVFQHWPWGPGGAMTLGNVIVHNGSSLDSLCSTYAHAAGECRQPQIILADHERAHVYQYMALGPLFLPLYFICGGVSARNRFERAADRYALTGHGWWPWSKRSASSR